MSIQGAADADNTVVELDMEHTLGGDRFASGLRCLFRAVGFDDEMAAWMVGDLDSANMYAHPETADMIGKSTSAAGRHHGARARQRGRGLGPHHHSGHGAVSDSLHMQFNATLHQDALISPALRIVRDILDRAPRPCG